MRANTNWGRRLAVVLLTAATLTPSLVQAQPPQTEPDETGCRDVINGGYQWPADGPLFFEIELVGENGVRCIDTDVTYHLDVYADEQATDLIATLTDADPGSAASQITFDVEFPGRDEVCVVVRTTTTFAHWETLHDRAPDLDFADGPCGVLVRETPLDALPGFGPPGYSGWN